MDQKEKWTRPKEEHTQESEVGGNRLLGIGENASGAGEQRDGWAEEWPGWAAGEGKA